MAAYFIVKAPIEILFVKIYGGGEIMSRLKWILNPVLIITLSLAFISCEIKPVMTRSDKKAIDQEKTHWFPKIEPEKLMNRKGFYFIEGLNGYQQTTDYTCGPVVLMKISMYYHKGDVTASSFTEMRIAQEAGARSFDVIGKGGKPGTTPDEMKRWLETHGFDVRIDYEKKDDGSALRQLQANVMNGIPTIVEWADLGGHWVIVVGYDTRGNDDPWDDVIIFADSYDKYDDYNDGYSFVNANRFYWLWYDAFYFEKLTWRTMITVKPL